MTFSDARLKCFRSLQGDASESDKKLKALLKKEDQIKKLVERQAKGETLEKNQVTSSSDRTLDATVEDAATTQPMRCLVS